MAPSGESVQGAPVGAEISAWLAALRADIDMLGAGIDALRVNSDALHAGIDVLRANSDALCAGIDVLRAGYDARLTDLAAMQTDIAAIRARNTALIAPQSILIYCYCGGARGA